MEPNRKAFPCRNQMRREVASAALVMVLAALLWLVARSSVAAEANHPARAVPIPVFLDPDRRVDPRPGLRIPAIRFLTEDDYPPFNFMGVEGTLQGFNIDLTRAICAELGANCTIQPRRWELLLPALELGEGDAVVASHRIDTELRRQFEVSAVVYRVPARFVGAKNLTIDNANVETLAGRTIAVVGGSRHEAYLNALFPAVRIARFATTVEALEAVRRGAADLAFADGLAIAFWLNGSESLDCCRFIGGAFAESRFFGEGAGIVMRKGQTELRQAINAALWRISRDGRFARLYLKHFPVPFY